MPDATLTVDPGRDRYTLAVTFRLDEFHGIMDRYSRVVVDRAVDQIVTDLLASAAVQARISVIRAALPLRIEEAVAKALTAEILA